MSWRTCAVKDCHNKTGRLMDEGWGKMLPVCNDCVVSGRYKELIPAPEAPAPPVKKPKTSKPKK
jgi:hypothetical protein